MGVDPKNFPIKVSINNRAFIACGSCPNARHARFIYNADDVLRFLMDHECDGEEGCRTTATA